MKPASFRDRRSFLKSSALAGLAAGAPAIAAPGADKNGRLRVFQIGVGGIGGLQRKQLKDHPMVEFVGFCDVDAKELDQTEGEFPQAFRVADYRQAFDERLDEFDAVIVDTPDFHHAPQMIAALEAGKHVYGQKPLVQQLDELRLVREALAKHPELVTQMGNQRASLKGRMQAVEILKSDQLGKPLEAHVWTGGMSRGRFFADAWQPLPEGQPAPDHLAWNLWRGPLKQDIGYSEDLAPRRWRSFWATGCGMLGDWGAHLIDALYYAYDLPSPLAVQTFTPRPSNDSHSGHNASTITYPGGERFGRDEFVLHFNDGGMSPSPASLGLPPFPGGGNKTLVVCEEGALLLEPGGEFQVFRDGKVVDEPRPEVEPRHHWHDWADNCLGAKKPLWSPFEIGARITEPCLLAVKATRFPGQELRWDGERFTNHDKANQQVLGRDYREGFGPPALG